MTYSFVYGVIVYFLSKFIPVCASFHYRQASCQTRHYTLLKVKFKKKKKFPLLKEEGDLPPVLSPAHWGTGGLPGWLGLAGSFKGHCDVESDDESLTER